MISGDRQPERAVRQLEDAVQTDFRNAMSYSRYLDLERLLSAQHPRSRPEHHDELLFIIQHQTSELWLMLVLHELKAARRLLDDDELGPALKCLARVKNILRTLTEQWSVLATLTPREYMQFRHALTGASGIQSYQYRAVEFILGNKNPAMLKIFENEPAAYQMLTGLLDEPTLYDAFLGYLARSGLPVPEEVLNRTYREPWTYQASIVPIFRQIYECASTPWAIYEACEDLVDVEDNFQLWRFRHMRTVMRTIGLKTGTGGSSGVGFLRQALDLTFFPELFTVRTELGT